MPWVTMRYLQRRCLVVLNSRPLRMSRYLHTTAVKTWDDSTPYMQL